LNKIIRIVREGKFVIYIKKTIDLGFAITRMRSGKIANSLEIIASTFVNDDFLIALKNTIDLIIGESLEK
jgi:hypothetical protein